MDLENPVVALCIQGTQAEFAGRQAEAYALYQQAWERARDDYEACIAAHYVARIQADAEWRLNWNTEALNRANRCTDPRVKAFYPSLYLNLGEAYELAGSLEQAQYWYDMAASLGFPHQTE